MPKIGAHVSIAGGVENAITNAQNIGADCIQIFGSSPRQWLVRSLKGENIKRYKKIVVSSGIGPVWLHAAYLVNLASPIPDLWNKSVKNLAEHLAIAEELGAEGLIFHPGSGKRINREKAINKVAAGVKAVLKSSPGRAKLAIENTAGGGDKLGSNAQEIGKIFKKASSKRVVVCFDTAHGLEAGSIDYKSKKSVKKALDFWDKHLGLKNIAVVHANDSKTNLGSNHDRHENIGQGFIGLAGFKNLAADGRLNNKPWILEVPGFDNKGPDKKNIEILKSIF